MNFGNIGGNMRMKGWEMVDIYIMVIEHPVIS
jgi:hypothetical protein